ncbi:MAG TPA: hypothetical protein VK525_15170 [Candidatus Saccharimonadales bacterium]|nr:hypothetical protein [Candidatus Saccharimonadales bacterium]
MIIPAFDIFRTIEGEAHWVESAMSLDEARARIEVLQRDAPGAYFIFDQKTRLRFPEPSDAVADATVQKPVDGREQNQAGAG